MQGVNFEKKERLKGISRQLNHQRRSKKEKDMEQAAGELEEAQSRGDVAVAHRMVRRLAGTGIGAKKRVYYAAPVHQPTVEEWKESLAAK
eukprot:13432085-Heterocapsa_arctica.AAC.1